MTIIELQASTVGMSKMCADLEKEKKGMGKAVIAMLIEEFCFNLDLNSSEVSREIAEKLAQTNDTYGIYGKEDK